MATVHLIALPSDPGGSGPATLAVTRFPCVIGRHSGSDLRLGEACVSRRHCVLSLAGGAIVIEDLGSLNGTRVNGEPVQGARPLTDGDRLEVAHLRFLVRLSETTADDAIDLGALPPEGEGGTTRRKLT